AGGPARCLRRSGGQGPSDDCPDRHADRNGRGSDRRPEAGRPRRRRPEGAQGRDGTCGGQGEAQGQSGAASLSSQKEQQPVVPEERHMARCPALLLAARFPSTLFAISHDKDTAPKKGDDPRAVKPALLLRYTFAKMKKDEVPDDSGNGLAGKVVKGKAVKDDE